MSKPNAPKSAAYVEAMIREAVTHVEACIKAPLADLGYTGPEAGLELTDGQHDFLAGYIWGGLQRLLELGELPSEDDVERAANRLYARLIGPFDSDFRSWHMWVIREGLKNLQRPHALLGYCAGRGDVLERMRARDFRAALGPALANLTGRDLRPGETDRQVGGPTGDGA
ncbi:MAG: hypothetical protein AAF845_08325 [Bacteroidota bacterium]